MNETEIITKETPIKELIDKHPEVVEILMGYGLHCVNCHFSEFDTLEDGALMHGIDDEEFELMLKDVRKVVGEEEKSDRKEKKE